MWVVVGGCSDDYRDRSTSSTVSISKKFQSVLERFKDALEEFDKHYFRSDRWESERWTIKEVSRVIWLFSLYFIPFFPAGGLRASPLLYIEQIGV